MTIKELLAASNIDRKEGEIILSSLLACRREWLLSHDEEMVDEERCLAFQEASKKRQAGWPVAYLCGRQGFYGYEFKVSKDVLIPRPETELLVDQILAALTRQEQAALLADIGTGSGAIIISCAKNEKIADLKANDLLTIEALDVSKSALDIAKQNAVNNEVSHLINFYESDLLEKRLKDWQNFNGRLFLAANLPYLSQEQIIASPSIQEEPRQALDGGGNDGLEIYCRLFKQLSDNGLWTKISLLICEIDPSQSIPISEKAKTAIGDSSLEISIKKDLSAKDRFLIIKPR